MRNIRILKGLLPLNLAFEYKIMIIGGAGTRMRVVRGETKGHHSASQQPAGGSLSPLKDQDLEGAAILILLPRDANNPIAFCCCLCLRVR